MEASDEPPRLSPFLKQLASTERREREKAIESLRIFLSRQQKFDELDFLKLWKGLYYCMWMCDRMRVQQQLADTLADLVSVLQTDNTILFIQAFWTILAKQWPNLDQHRLDKFYLLARRYVNAAFRFLKKEEWSEELLKEYTKMLSAGPLHPKNPKIPNSIRYHIVDIYTEELNKIEPLDSVDDEFLTTLTQLLQPLVNIREESLDKVARSKVAEQLENLKTDVPSIKI